MPEFIHGVDGEREYENADERAGADLFPQRDLLRDEEQRHKQQREHTAVEDGQSLGAHGVVGVEKELGRKVDEVKPRLVAVGRVREGRLAEAERIVGGQDDAGGKPYGDRREQPHAEERAQEVLLLAKRVCIDAEVGIEEVDEAENAHHVADVEVGEDRKPQRKREQQVLLLGDQLFDAERDEREQHHAVNPHGVVLIDHAVARERIERAEDDACGSRADIVRLEIICKRERAEAALEREDHEERVEDVVRRKERDEEGKRACKIVGEDAEKFAAQRPGEKVEEACVAVQHAAERAEKVDVLRVEVEHEHRLAAKRVDAERKISRQQHQRRAEKRDGEVGVRMFFLDFFRRRGGGCVNGGKLFIHGFSPFFLDCPAAKSA